VYNAGVSPWTGNTVDCTLESWQRVINVNLTGTWLGMKYQIPAMLKNGRDGAIVNMTSVAAQQVFEGYPVYSASNGVWWASRKLLPGSSPPMAFA